MRRTSTTPSNPSPNPNPSPSPNPNPNPDPNQDIDDTMTAERVMLLDAIVAGDLDGIRASTQVRPPATVASAACNPV